MILSVLSTCLLGCSGSGSGGGSSSPAAAAHSTEANLRYQLDIASSTSSYGTFDASTNLDITVEQYRELVSAQQILTIDTIELGCEVKHQTLEEFDTATSVDLSTLLESDFISAGDVLTITSPAGTWAELPQDIDSFWEGFYDTDSIERDLGVLPAMSTLDIPGDTFPQIGSVALLSPELLTSVAYRENGMPLAQTDLVTPNTSVHWDRASTTTNSMIVISFSTYDDAGISFAQCVVEDNGQYQFPASVRENMDATYANHALFRIQQSTEQRDDVLITQFAISSFYQL